MARTPFFFWLPVLSSLTLCAAVGCGDDSIVVTNTSETTATTEPTSTDTGASTSTSSTSGVTETQGETESSTASTSTTGDPTTTTSTSTSTGSATDVTTSTTSTTGTDTGTDTDTGGSEDADYAAIYVPGGLDRIFIRKAEKMSGLCTHLGLVWPASDDEPYSITTPDVWGVESARISEGLTGCLEFEPMVQPMVAAATGNGTVVWAGDDFCPPELDLDVTLQFVAGDLDWVPMKDQLTALELAVEGCQ